MVNLNFDNIRDYDGSKDKGFEELICQLAHLTPPDNAKYFIRKEGDGGDGGVECYWKLNDDKEHAWQAKYFLDVIADSQWNQISKSVETALEKHPKLAIYYICLPRDWTDSRKKIKGKCVKSSWDKWIEHVKQWEQFAREKGMSVKFGFWCKHEISQMLQVDKPKFAGRALYWFNEPIISTGVLVNIALNSKKSLGERFTPEFHIDLPIANKFECLGLTWKWQKQLKDQLSNLSDMKADYKRIINYRIKLLDDRIIWNKLNDNIKSFHYEFSCTISEGDLFKNIENLRKLCEIVYKELNNCNDVLYDVLIKEKDKELEKKLREFSNELRKMSTIIDGISEFLNDNTILAGKNRSLLLLGEAGIGKSHLLCDLAMKRLEEDLPTIFLLGQHYSGGNPLDFICSELGLKEHPHRIVLGALDALGESKNTRLLLIIDAINEGANRDSWYDNIVRFLSELGDFHNIAVALSCRSTYKDFLIPKELTSDKLATLTHFGFSGYENRAALKYLSKQGISKPGTPILNPEFSNPLFLKTCCKAIKRIGNNKFPKGLIGFNKLFEFYIDSVEDVIGRKKKYRSSENIVWRTIKRFVSEIYPKNMAGVPIDVARKIINEMDSNHGIGETLFELLIDEGILAYDITYTNTEIERGFEVVRFTYERFSDYTIAMNILQSCTTDKDVSKLFEESAEIGNIINKNNRYRYRGIIEALGIGIPEKFNKEFVEFIEFGDDKEFRYDWFFNRTFKDIILWRTGKSITSKSLEMLNQISNHGYHDGSLGILLSLSTEPEHPWNADFLHAHLDKMKMPERDAFWSTYIAINDKSEDEDSEETVVRTIIDWALNAEFEDVEIERLRLTAIILIWITTTSNRKVRDQATKSLSRVLYYIPNKIVYFLEKFDKCEDAYLLERLYAAIYGAILQLDSNEIIKDIAVCVYNYQFKNNRPYPHILLRDYARGILEFAHDRKAFDDMIYSAENFRPPYYSEWPIENPSISEIDEIVGNKYSAIKSSLSGYIGDFGKYTMRCIHDWSPTSIYEERAETGIELKCKFSERLPEELRTRYCNYLNTKVENSKSAEKIDIEVWLKELAEDELKDIDIRIDEAIVFVK